MDDDNAKVKPARRPGRRRVWWLAVAAVVFFLLGALMFLPRDRQPQYQGRSLMAWAADLNLADPVRHAAAEQAVRAIGTNGLPVLVGFLDRRDPWLGPAVLRAENKLPRRLYRLVYARVKPQQAALDRRDAARALGVLGPQAVPVAGALGRALADPQVMVSVAAADALVAIGQPAVPVLLAALPSAADPAKRSILPALGRLKPDPAVAAPVLQQLLNRTENNDVFTLTARTMQTVGADAVAPLLDMLASDQPATRARAGQGLVAVAADHFSAFLAVLSAFPSLSVTVRREVVSVVGQLPAYKRRSAPVMARALLDEDAEVQNAAAAWLRANYSADDLDKILLNEGDIVREQARAIYAVPTAAAATNATPP
jgi:hypothetical protein